MAYKILKSPKARPIRGVLFDMDGLVLDSEILYTRFWREAAQELGFPMTFEQSLGIRSLNRFWGQQFLEKCFGPTVDYEAIRKVRVRRMDAYVAEHGIQPKPGIFELLEYLHSHHIACAITTSTPMDHVKMHLEPLGLYDQFDKLCSGQDLPHGKPDPDIYLFGARQLGLRPEECLALEDSPAGIESGYRAGCFSVIVPDLDQPSDELLEHCFGRVDSLLDVRDLLDELNG